MQSLIDVISANRKDLKFKQALLPALGELIYIVSCQVIIDYLKRRKKAVI